MGLFATLSIGRHYAQCRVFHSYAERRSPLLPASHIKHLLGSMRLLFYYSAVTAGPEAIQKIAWDYEAGVTLATGINN